ncbi:MAG: hypothetical protein JW714_00385 [Candidatus Omnitrophica bacterium]|nr:hypothetical protein [Candidatus Omnitrophota bacterium]
MMSITGRKAFTLMEMLVVLGVIILLLGVSIPFFASFSKGAKLKTAAKDVTAILNTARSLAINQRANYSVVFDYSEFPHSYYIADASQTAVNKKYYLPKTIRFYRPSDPEAPTNFSEDKATFSTTGGLTANSGSVWLSDKKGDFRRVNVSNTTGRVKIDQEP